MHSKGDDKKGNTSVRQQRTDQHYRRDGMPRTYEAKHRIGNGMREARQFHQFPKHGFQHEEWEIELYKADHTISKHAGVDGQDRSRISEENRAKRSDRSK